MVPVRSTRRWMTFTCISNPPGGGKGVLDPPQCGHQGQGCCTIFPARLLPPATICTSSMTSRQKHVPISTDATLSGTGSSCCRLGRFHGSTWELAMIRWWDFNVRRST